MAAVAAAPVMPLPVYVRARSSPLLTRACSVTPDFAASRKPSSDRSVGTAVVSVTVFVVLPCLTRADALTSFAANKAFRKASIV